MYNCNCNVNNANSCPNINLTISANATQLAPCDLITYTVTITNEDHNVTYGLFKDNMPCPLVFLPGTVTINGQNYPTLNPTSGFNVNFLTMGNTITITYVAKDASGNETRVERTIKVLKGTNVGLIIGCAVGGVAVVGGGVAGLLIVKKKKKLA